MHCLVQMLMTPVTSQDLQFASSLVYFQLALPMVLWLYNQVRLGNKVLPNNQYTYLGSNDH